MLFVCDAGPHGSEYRRARGSQQAGAECGVSLELPILSAAKGVRATAGHLHTSALSVMNGDPKNRHRPTKVVSRSGRRPAHLSLYYACKISLLGNLQDSVRRLQSWHINCDSVDLAKG